MKRFIIGLWILLAVIMSCYVPAGHTAPIDPGLQPETIVNCVLPVEREDGTAFDFATEGDKVRFYYGFQQGTYTLIEDRTACQWKIDNKPLLGKSIYFVVTVTDNMGRESSYSVETVHEVGGVVTDPKSPTGITLDSPVVIIDPPTPMGEVNSAPR